MARSLAKSTLKKFKSQLEEEKERLVALIEERERKMEEAKATETASERNPDPDSADAASMKFEYMKEMSLERNTGAIDLDESLSTLVREGWVDFEEARARARAPEDFDIDRFNRSQPAKLDHLSVATLIEQFRAVRTETIAIVTGMADSDFDREGRHPFHGHGRLERFIRWAYEHQRLHENDVRRALADCEW